jgi:hypothetical protein
LTNGSLSLSFVPMITGGKQILGFKLQPTPEASPVAPAPIPVAKKAATKKTAAKKAAKKQASNVGE